MENKPSQSPPKGADGAKPINLGNTSRMAAMAQSIQNLRRRLGNATLAKNKGVEKIQ